MRRQGTTSRADEAPGGCQRVDGRRAGGRARAGVGARRVAVAGVEGIDEPLRESGRPKADGGQQPQPGRPCGRQGWAGSPGCGRTPEAKLGDVSAHLQSQSHPPLRDETGCCHALAQRARCAGRSRGGVVARRASLSRGLSTAGGRTSAAATVVATAAAAAAVTAASSTVGRSWMGRLCGSSLGPPSGAWLLVVLELWYISHAVLRQRCPPPDEPWASAWPSAGQINRARDECPPLSQSSGLHAPAMERRQTAARRILYAPSRRRRRCLSGTWLQPSASPLLGLDISCCFRPSRPERGSLLPAQVVQVVADNACALATVAVKRHAAMQAMQPRGVGHPPWLPFRSIHGRSVPSDPIGLCALDCHSTPTPVPAQSQHSPSSVPAQYQWPPPPMLAPPDLSCPRVPVSLASKTLLPAAEKENCPAPAPATPPAHPPNFSAMDRPPANPPSERYPAGRPKLDGRLSTCSLCV